MSLGFRIFNKEIMMAPKLRYRVNTMKLGWTSWVQNGDVAGNLADPSDSISAIEMKLDGATDGLIITYAVSLNGPGLWTPLVSNGLTAGIPGASLKVDKIYMDLVNAGNHILLYSVFVNPIQWTPWVVSSGTNSTDGVGLEDNPVQALRIMFI
jgi:hypothetical protein